MTTTHINKVAASMTIAVSLIFFGAWSVVFCAPVLQKETNSKIRQATSFILASKLV